MAGQSPSDETDDFQVPLLNVFRSAARAHDERQSAAATAEGGDREVSKHHIERREGIGLDDLRKYLLEDLANLMSTIHLEATRDLDDYPRVRTSILNYGVMDVSRLSKAQTDAKSLEKKFRQSLLDHEPRLIPSTVKVKLHDRQDDVSHSVGFDVEAVMAARPVDVPLEFVAEIDVGAGKVQMAKLAVNK